MEQRKVISALLYKFIERLAVKGIGLVISVLLARLIAPETFGLLAIITVFVNIAQAFVQSGLGMALVQNRTTKEEDYSTVFLFSIVMALVLVVGLYFIAPAVAWLYHDTVLIWPLRILSLSLLFGALNSVQNAKLQREMRFSIMMRCNLASTVVSGVAGVVAAYLGAGIWALVIYSLLNSIIATFLTGIAGKWHPRLQFSMERMRTFWGFGWKMLVSGLLCTIYNDVRTLIVGKKYSTTDLAYYNRGYQFPEIIATTLDNSVQTVMLPVMAAEQDAREKFNKILLRALSMSMFIVAPVMLGLGSVARTFIPLLLTEKWVQSVRLMVVFCFSFLTVPVMMTNLTALKAMGRSDIYMKTEGVRRVVMLAVLLTSVFLFDSVMAIAIGFLISSFIDILIIIEAVKKQTGVGFKEQTLALWKSLASAGIMAVVVFAMNRLVIPAIIRLLLQVAAGCAIYILCSIVLKNEAYLYGLRTLKKLMSKKTRKGDKQC